MAELLSDNNTYEVLKRDPTACPKKKVIDCLQELENQKTIDRPTYCSLYPGQSTPWIYGIPKIQKDGIPFRSIANSINSHSTFYILTKHLSTILAPQVGNTPTTFITQQTTGKIKDLILEMGKIMDSPYGSSVNDCLSQKEQASHQVTSAVCWTFASPPPIFSIKGDSTDRNIAAPWDHRYFQLWQTFTWKKSKERLLNISRALLQAIGSDMWTIPGLKSKP